MSSSSDSTPNEENGDQSQDIMEISSSQLLLEDQLLSDCGSEWIHASELNFNGQDRSRDSSPKDSAGLGDYLQLVEGPKDPEEMRGSLSKDGSHSHQKEVDRIWREKTSQLSKELAIQRVANQQLLANEVKCQTHIEELKKQNIALRAENTKLRANSRLPLSLRKGYKVQKASIRKTDGGSNARQLLLNCSLCVLVSIGVSYLFIHAKQHEQLEKEKKPSEIPEELLQRFEELEQGLEKTKRQLSESKRYFGDYGKRLQRIEMGQSLDFELFKAVLPRPNHERKLRILAKSVENPPSLPFWRDGQEFACLPSFLRENLHNLLTLLVHGYGASMYAEGVEIDRFGSEELHLPPQAIDLLINLFTSTKTPQRLVKYLAIDFRYLGSGQELPEWWKKNARDAREERSCLVLEKELTNEYNPTNAKFALKIRACDGKMATFGIRKRL